MNAANNHEAESVTRSIARWGSAAAAIIFGTALVTDKALSWDVVSGQWIHIGILAAIFAIFMGYALAWAKRFEVLGSVIALISMLAVYAIILATRNVPPNPFFLAVGAPAVFHLITIVHGAKTEPWTARLDRLLLNQ